MGTLRRPLLRPLRAVALPVLAAVLALGNHRCYDEHWSDRDELRGREWVLQVFQHEDGTTTVAKDGAFTLEFEDDESVSVRADCNRCGGSYDAPGSLRLRISSLACTRAFCAETAPFDTEYVQQLSDANTYFLEGRILTIHTDDGVLIFDR